MVDNEFSDTQRAASANRNYNTNNRIIGVPKKVDEAPELFIDKYRIIKGEPYHLVYEVTVHGIRIVRTVLIEIVYE